MNYLSNSRFDLHLTLDEVETAEDKREKMAAAWADQKVLLPLYEEQLTRVAIDKLRLLFQVTPLTDWYVLVGSERNLHLLAPLNGGNVRLGVYVPTDELIKHCICFNRNFNFGFQTDLLRRLFILNVDPFVLADADAIKDEQHYLEMAASFSRELFFLRNSTRADEIAAHFQSLSNSKTN